MEKVALVCKIPSWSLNGASKVISSEQLAGEKMNIETFFSCHRIVPNKSAVSVVSLDGPPRFGSRASCSCDVIAAFST